MTNKEILQADLLDIIFEKRNKDYGAYALRRGYDHRLLTAIGAALSVILLFVLINISGKKNVSSALPYRNERIVEITEVKMFKEKPRETEKPPETKKPVEKIASGKYVSKIEIKPDDKVKEIMPVVTSLGDKMISDKKQVGKKTMEYPSKKKNRRKPETGIQL